MVLDKNSMHSKLPVSPGPDSSMSLEGVLHGRKVDTHLIRNPWLSCGNRGTLTQMLREEKGFLSVGILPVNVREHHSGRFTRSLAFLCALSP